MNSNTIELSPRLFHSIADSPPDAPLSRAVDRDVSLAPLPSSFDSPPPVPITNNTNKQISPLTATFLRATLGSAGAQQQAACWPPELSATPQNTRGQCDETTMMGGDQPIVDLKHPSPGMSPPRLWEPTGIKFYDLVDASAWPPQYKYTVTGARVKQDVPGAPQLGLQIVVNAKAVALFRYKNSPIAIAAHCPHMGAELQLGDIEDFGSHLCVTCPRHRYMFDLQSGALLRPEGKAAQYRLQSYHARVDRDGFVEIGFRGLGEALFEECHW